MNIRTTGRLLVLFFTRPIRLADFAFLPGFLLAMAKSVKQPKEVQVADKPDFEPTRVMSSRRSGEAFDAWGRSNEVAVSEEALDTLPAELQDELTAKKQSLVTPPQKPDGGPA